ncbi:MAG: molybdopterin-dependent oxidoreductase [Coriobacteriia bacterium]|nr:molybdopterin-dependent oxidoreductase [Coriobacteriia bacterium]
MQELTLTRRSFVKTATLAGAAVALGTQVSGVLGKADKAWADEASETKMYVSTCHGCIQVCPCRVYVKEGVVVKLEGHPIAPQSLGSMCLKGLSQLHTAYSPQRVLYPLKRAGDRGAENAVWERISWEDAIELASTKIAETIEKYGTYSFFSSFGGGGAYSGNQARTIPMNLGSPTTFEPGAAQCYLPRHAIASLMYGGQSQSIADSAANEPFKGLSPWEKAKGLNNDTKVLVLWAAQPSVSQTAQSGRGMAELRALGCKTVVIDPSLTPDAAKATVWLRIRPGTDCAMILAWWRYIIDKKLYDEDFVKTWTNLPFVIDPATHLPLFATDVWPDYEQTAPLNTPAYVCFDKKTNSLMPFEYLSKDVDPEIFWSGTVNGKTCRTAGQIYKDAADPYTLAKTEELCWVPADLIEKAIKIYAEAPAAGIAHGVATDMEQNASQAPVGLIGLDMLMGYVNKPGVTLTQNDRSVRPGPQPRPTMRVVGTGGNPGTYGSLYEIGYMIGATEEENEKRVMALPPGMENKCQGSVYVMNQVMIDRLGTKNYKGLHAWVHSHIPSVLEAIKTGEPFKPRVWYELSGNKLAMLGNAGTWYNVFNEVDFCVAQFPNFTSSQMEVADLMLPIEEWLEAPMTRSQLNYNFPQPQIIHLGETVSNNVAPQKILNATCKKLNAYLDAGNKIVFGAVGAVTGASKATPSPSSTSADPNEKETERNSNFLYDFDVSKIEMRFPFGGNLGSGAEEDSVVLQQLADRFGAPDHEALLNDLAFQQPDLDDPSDPTFVDSPEAYWAYNQHLAPANDGLLRGFSTESRKCEAYCSILVKMADTGFPYCYPRGQQPVDSIIGQEYKDYDPSYAYVGTYSPICQHVEPAESPVEGMPGYDPEYPLVMTSGRVYYFHHGTMRHAPFIRELYPVPDVRMHPDTAKAHGLEHMDWVKITSRRGSTSGRVYCTTGQDPRVLWMERHWNPECYDNSQKSKSGGWRECNVNVLTKSSPPYNEVFGSYTNRGFQVKIEKGTRPERIWVEPKEFEPFMPHNPNQYVPEAGSALEMGSTPNVTFNDWNR